MSSKRRPISVLSSRDTMTQEDPQQQQQASDCLPRFEEHALNMES